MEMDSDAFTRFRNRGEPTNGQSCSPTKAIMRCSGKFATAYWSTYHQPEIWVKYLKQRTDSFATSNYNIATFHLNILVLVKSQSLIIRVGETAIDYDDVLQTILG